MTIIETLQAELDNAAPYNKSGDKIASTTEGGHVYTAIAERCIATRSSRTWFRVRYQMDGNRISKDALSAVE
tara:strand:+ start:1304 stop:1519 length:216 start_codon:yes stop_codon:yes gene_type:complete